MERLPRTTKSVEGFWSLHLQQLKDPVKLGAPPGPERDEVTALTERTLLEEGITVGVLGDPLRTENSDFAAATSPGAMHAGVPGAWKQNLRSSSLALCVGPSPNSACANGTKAMAGYFCVRKTRNSGQASCWQSPA